MPLATAATSHVTQARCLVVCLALCLTALVHLLPSLPASAQPCPDMADARREMKHLDTSGGRPGTANLRLNTLLRSVAECFSRNKDEAAAETVVDGLLAYAAVVPRWPMLDRSGAPAGTVDWNDWDLSGLWGGNWVYQDLRMSANLARAFEKISASKALNAAGKARGIDAAKVIREDLLRYLVDLNLRFGRSGILGGNTREAYFPFSNMDPMRLRSLAVFGRVVDPAYTHIAVNLIRNFPHVAFFRDGFWHEGTVSYHRQLVTLLDAAIRELAGYSDPPGYSFPGSYTTRFGDRYDAPPGRFDHLQPEGEQATAFARIRRAAKPFTLPDGRVVTRNDTHHTERRPRTDAPTASQCLFGVRHCILVAGTGEDRSIVHLTFGGTEGHEHLDKLHVDIWAAGRLLASDGDYWRASPRKWNTSTLAHNTVVVDGRDQHGRMARQRTLTDLDLIPGIGHHLWQGLGQGNTINNGDLLAADISGGPIQYVVADATRSYTQAGIPDIYERTVVLVAPPTRMPYLVDVFRVRGGRHHRWMLHGDLGRRYDLTTSLATAPFEKPLSLHLMAERRGTTLASWQSTLDFPGGIRMVTHHLQAKRATAYIATGPAHGLDGKAGYLAVDHAGPDSVFIKLHDLSGNGTAITAARLTRPVETATSDVHLRVRAPGGEVDRITLAWLDDPALGGNEPRLRLVTRDTSGSCRLAYEGDRPHPQRQWQDSAVSVRPPEPDGEKGGFAVAADLPTKPDLFHARMPNGVVESYRITSTPPKHEPGAWIEVEGPPGIEIRAPGNSGAAGSVVKYLYYPGSGYAGQLEWRLTTNGQVPCKPTR